MIKQFTVTGTPPFNFRGETLAPGSVVDLPSQFADQFLATGAIAPAPADARSIEPPKPAAAKATGRKAAEVKAPKEASPKEAQAKREPK